MVRLNPRPKHTLTSQEICDEIRRRQQDGRYDLPVEVIEQPVRELKVRVVEVPAEPGPPLTIRVRVIEQS